ncbi:MAG: hypothetical protein ACYCSN_13540 [Acidobacteriaceae bacterium]
MIGHVKQNPSEGVLPMDQDPPGLTDAAFLFSPEAARPWTVSGSARGQLASAETFGDGLLQVANKPSEVNILNSLPIVIVTGQLPPSKFSLQTQRTISLNIRGL